MSDGHVVPQMTLRTFWYWESVIGRGQKGPLLLGQWCIYLVALSPQQPLLHTVHQFCPPFPPQRFQPWQQLFRGLTRQLGAQMAHTHTHTHKGLVDFMEESKQSRKEWLINPLSSLPTVQAPAGEDWIRRGSHTKEIVPSIITVLAAARSGL